MSIFKLSKSETLSTLNIISVKNGTPVKDKAEGNRAE